MHQLIGVQAALHQGFRSASAHGRDRLFGRRMAVGRVDPVEALALLRAG